MKLTKEDCQKALKDFTFEVLRNYNNTKFDEKSKKQVLKSRFQKQHDLLDQLIKEHFKLVSKCDMLDKALDELLENLSDNDTITKERWKEILLNETN